MDHGAGSVIGQLVCGIRMNQGLHFLCQIFRQGNGGIILHIPGDGIALLQGIGHYFQRFEIQGAVFHLYQPDLAVLGDLPFPSSGTVGSGAVDCPAGKILQGSLLQSAFIHFFRSAWEGSNQQAQCKQAEQFSFHRNPLLSYTGRMNGVFCYIHHNKRRRKCPGWRKNRQDMCFLSGRDCDTMNTAHQMERKGFPWRSTKICFPSSARAMRK